ncbi:MAG: thiamine-phosphate kinase [Brachymonas sp.]|nr:thiamine-phosphate kinase [Brachymonas sp.]
MSSSPTAAGEFSLIARHFQRRQPLRHAALGLGDDCALLQPLPGEQLAISTDTLVADRHFFADADPAAIGHKALAVNLSDLAAMGAQPLAFTLALTLPAADEPWLAAFAHGLLALADAHGCDLIGGDTTRGPLSLTITVFGSVPREQALLRSGAQAGDDIYVSHGATQGLGDALLALHLLQAQKGQAPAPALGYLSASQQSALLQTLQARLEWPTPRVALGQQLRGVASACIDLSDGLQGDIRHLLAASGTGATLWAQNPDGTGLLTAASPSLRTLGDAAAIDYALAGGDDYELLFTAAPAQRAALHAIANRTHLALARIGQMDAAPGLRLQHANGQAEAVAGKGYDHFS